jgi:hypothetical protein
MAPPPQKSDGKSDGRASLPKDNSKVQRNKADRAGQDDTKVLSPAAQLAKDRFIAALKSGQGTSGAILAMYRDSEVPPTAKPTVLAPPPTPEREEEVVAPQTVDSPPEGKKSPATDFNILTSTIKGLEAMLKALVAYVLPEPAGGTYVHAATRRGTWVDQKSTQYGARPAPKARKGQKAKKPKVPLFAAAKAAASSSSPRQSTRTNPSNEGKVIPENRRENSGQGAGRPHVSGLGSPAGPKTGATLQNNPKKAVAKLPPQANAEAPLLRRNRKGGRPIKVYSRYDDDAGELETREFGPPLDSLDAYTSAFREGRTASSSRGQTRLLFPPPTHYEAPLGERTYGRRGMLDVECREDGDDFE